MCLWRLSFDILCAISKSYRGGCGYATTVSVSEMYITCAWCETSHMFLCPTNPYRVSENLILPTARQPFQKPKTCYAKPLLRLSNFLSSLLLPIIPDLQYLGSLDCCRRARPKRTRGIRQYVFFRPVLSRSISP